MSYEIALGGEGEPLVGDARVERVFWQLQKLRDFPDGTQFLTLIQEPNTKEPRRLAIFLVLSPHPKRNARAITPHNVITMTAMPYERWKEMEANHRHYAGLTDPIRPIFAGILRRHLKHYNNLKELD